MADQDQQPKTIAEVIAAQTKAQADSRVAEAAPAEAKGTKAMTFKAVCVDDHGVIVGIGASIGVDKEDEAVGKAALIGMSYDFCASTERAFYANHDQKAGIEAELVCSWPGAPVLKSGKILGAGEEIPAGDSIVAINIEKGQETHWFVGIKPKDESVLKAARDGELKGFSWGGFAAKEAA